MRLRGFAHAHTHRATNSASDLGGLRENFLPLLRACLVLVTNTHCVPPQLGCTFVYCFRFGFSNTPYQVLVARSLSTALSKRHISQAVYLLQNGLLGWHHSRCTNNFCFADCEALMLMLRT